MMTPTDPARAAEPPDAAPLLYGSDVRVDFAAMEVLAYCVRKPWRGMRLNDATSELNKIGLDLFNPARKRGWWLVGRTGCQWYPDWQAAYRAVADGTCALVDLEMRL